MWTYQVYASLLKSDLQYSPLLVYHIYVLLLLVYPTLRYSVISFYYVFVNLPFPRVRISLLLLVILVCSFVSLFYSNNSIFYFLLIDYSTYSDQHSKSYCSFLARKNKEHAVSQLPGIRAPGGLCPGGLQKTQPGHQPAAWRGQTIETA